MAILTCSNFAAEVDAPYRGAAPQITALTCTNTAPNGQETSPDVPNLRSALSATAFRQQFRTVEHAIPRWAPIRDTEPKRPRERAAADQRNAA